MGSVALFRRPGIALLTCGLAMTSVLALRPGGAAAATGRTGAAGPADVAPGAPGAPSYFDLARKDCVGTAAGRGSKVWYTVAGGALSDVYEPTIDNTDVSTLQYIVTDGSTFTDLQTRDMTYTVAADPTGMACTVTATDAEHGYRPGTPCSCTRRSRRCPDPAPAWPACTCTRGSTRTSTATGAAAARTRAATPARSTPRRDPRCR